MAPPCRWGGLGRLTQQVCLRGAQQTTARVLQASVAGAQAGIVAPTPVPTRAAQPLLATVRTGQARYQLARRRRRGGRAEPATQTRYGRCTAATTACGALGPQSTTGQALSHAASPRRATVHCTCMGPPWRLAVACPPPDTRSHVRALIVTMCDAVAMCDSAVCRMHM